MTNWISKKTRESIHVVDQYPSYWKILVSLCYIAWIIIFILHLFYLRNQIALTGYFLLYAATDQDIAFLVPDSCRTTIRNGKSIDADFSENIIKQWLERRLFLLFLHNLDIILDFFYIAGYTQYTYNVGKW